MFAYAYEAVILSYDLSLLHFVVEAGVQWWELLSSLLNHFGGWLRMRNFDIQLLGPRP